MIPLALMSAASAVRANWKLIATAGVILALSLYAWRLDSLRAGYKADWQTEKAGRAADRSAYEKAQAQAAIDAYTAKIKKEAEDAKKADAADARYADLSEQYRAAVLRYQAAQRAAGGTNLSRPAEAPESGDRPGGPAIVPLGNILIPEADAFLCADHTARLQAVREWALYLTDPN